MANASQVPRQARSFDWARWVPRVGPLVISALVVGVILLRYPLPLIVARVREGAVLPVLGWAAALAVVYLCVAALADTLVLRRMTPTPVRFSEVARGKAASTVLTVLGYVIGSGGYGVWIARRTGLGAARTGAVVVYFMLSDLAAVGLVAGAVMPIAGVAVPGGVRVAAALIAGVPLLGMMLAPSLHVKNAMLEPWRALPRHEALLQLGVRALNVALAALATSLAAQAFGLVVPLATLLAYVPILLLITSLPINFAGLGAAQGAWLFFLTPFDDGARILAFQFVWSMALAVAMILRGLPFLRRALTQIT